jgi:hypothetical protein
MTSMLEKQLGAHWTEDVRSAWADTIGVVVETMKEGAAAGLAPTLVRRTWKVVEEQGLEENGVKLFRGAATAVIISG